MLMKEVNHENSLFSLLSPLSSLLSPLSSLLSSLSPLPFSPLPLIPPLPTGGYLTWPVTNTS